MDLMVKPRSRMSPEITVGLHGILWLIAIGFNLLLVPRLLSLFQDFGIDLPPGASVAFFVSNVVSRHMALVLLAFCALMALDWALLRVGERGHTRSWFPGLLSWAVLLLPVALLIFQVLTIGFVWWNLQGKLTG